MTRPTRQLVVLVALAMLLLLPGCLAAPRPDGPAAGRDEGPAQLERVEVREYEGLDLSSIDDFRENSIAGPQQVERDSYRLSISGFVETPESLSYEEVLAGRSYRKVVTLDCVEGWSVDILWEGVLLRDLIQNAGPRPPANTVVFRAQDGYSTSLPLDYLLDNEILLAYSMNGVELPAERGFPFQLVAEDKWGYKWIKWVTEIELTDDPTYRGYWENRGYSNSGDRDRSSRE
ncbi:MAG: molybdopterin-dependent oxidoreductase [Anaerosomatales bacterium]|nr:molybdopterin-dependent oxidoreductase [Anaerosomatales bacterium]MDT8433675.1 molybdopterin-dependent oxidoreductase [Anaerosomatales bacterium]